jgi:zinc transporter ZupT
MTPIGIIIGMFVEGSSKILELLFNSLAAGTFIYIGCSEVIIEEFSEPENKYLKLLSFLIGMIIIGCLRLLEGDDG